MTLAMFDRDVLSVVYPSEVDGGTLSDVLEKARGALDGDPPAVIYEVEGGHIVQGSDSAVFLGDDGTVELSELDADETHVTCHEHCEEALFSWVGENGVEVRRAGTDEKDSDGDGNTVLEVYSEAVHEEPCNVEDDRDVMRTELRVMEALGALGLEPADHPDGEMDETEEGFLLEELGQVEELRDFLSVLVDETPADDLDHAKLAEFEEAYQEGNYERADSIGQDIAGQLGRLDEILGYRRRSITQRVKTFRARKEFSRTQAARGGQSRGEHTQQLRKRRRLRRMVAKIRIAAKRLLRKRGHIYKRRRPLSIAASVIYSDGPELSESVRTCAKTLGEKLYGKSVMEGVAANNDGGKKGAQKKKPWESEVQAEYAKWTGAGMSEGEALAQIARELPVRGCKLAEDGITVEFEPVDEGGSALQSGDGERAKTAPWVYISFDDVDGKPRAAVWKKRAGLRDIEKARSHARTSDSNMRVHFGDKATTLAQVRAAHAKGKSLGESLDEAEVTLGKAHSRKTGGGTQVYMVNVTVDGEEMHLDVANERDQVIGGRVQWPGNVTGLRWGGWHAGPEVKLPAKLQKDVKATVAQLKRTGVKSSMVEGAGGPQKGDRVKLKADFARRNFGGTYPNVRGTVTGTPPGNSVTVKWDTKGLHPSIRDALDSTVVKSGVEVVSESLDEADFTLYRAALKADDEFQRALEKEYGKGRAGDARYRTDHPEHIAKLARRKVAADQKWLAAMRESVDEGDDKGGLANEVVTWFIKQAGRADAMMVRKQFRVNATAANRLVAIATRYMQAGKAQSHYDRFVREVGATLRGNVFESDVDEGARPRLKADDMRFIREKLLGAASDIKGGEFASAARQVGAAQKAGATTAQIHKMIPQPSRKKLATWLRQHEGEDSDTASLLDEGAVFAIGSGGLRKLSDAGAIHIEKDSMYYLGASTSPDLIVVTKVDSKFITYRHWPYTKDSKVEHRIGQDLISRGTTTALRSFGNRMDADEKKTLQANLKGERGPLNGKRPFRLFQRVMVTFKPTSKTKDFYSQAQAWGVMAGAFRDVDDPDPVAEVLVPRMEIPHAKKDPAVQVVKVGSKVHESEEQACLVS